MDDISGDMPGVNQLARTGVDRGDVHAVRVCNCTDDLKESQKADPVEWGWAAEYFAHCAAQEEAVFEIKSTGFVAKFMTSAV